MEELSSLHNSGSYMVHKERMESIVCQLDELWTREEIFWHQLSRVKWLKSGDKNTRFFHLSTIQRRQRKKIQMVKSLDGDWLKGDAEISKGFNAYFNHLLHLMGLRTGKVLLIVFLVLLVRK